MSQDNQLIASDTQFTGEQKLTLQSLVARIIPASDEYDVPGADDPDIFSEILHATAPLATEICRGLEDLDRLSDTERGSRFSDLTGTDKTDIADHLNGIDCAKPMNKVNQLLFLQVAKRSVGFRPDGSIVEMVIGPQRFTLIDSQPFRSHDALSPFFDLTAKSTNHRFPYIHHTHYRQ